MAEFKIAFQKTLSHEGSYSNDPDDKGGETYKGIARASHSNWQGWSIVDKHKGNPDFPEILEKNTLLQQEVNHLYWINFWFPLNADRILNQSIAGSIFDFGVNAGIHTSIRMVQSIIGADVDGILGIQTLNKLNTFDPAVFLPVFTIARIEHYVSLVKKRPLNHKYFYGWVARALNNNE